MAIGAGRVRNAWKLGAARGAATGAGGTGAGATGAGAAGAGAAGPGLRHGGGYGGAQRGRQRREGLALGRGLAQRGEERCRVEIVAVEGVRGEPQRRQREVGVDLAGADLEAAVGGQEGAAQPRDLAAGVERAARPRPQRLGEHLLGEADQPAAGDPRGGGLVGEPERQGRRRDVGIAGRQRRQLGAGDRQLELAAEGRDQPLAGDARLVGDERQLARREAGQHVVEQEVVVEREAGGVFRADALADEIVEVDEGLPLGDLDVDRLDVAELVADDAGDAAAIEVRDEIAELAEVDRGRLQPGEFLAAEEHRLVALGPGAGEARPVLQRRAAGAELQRQVDPAGHEVVVRRDQPDPRIDDAARLQEPAVMEQRVLDRGGAGLVGADVEDDLRHARFLLPAPPRPAARDAPPRAARRGRPRHTARSAPASPSRPIRSRR